MVFAPELAELIGSSQRETEWFFHLCSPVIEVAHITELDIHELVTIKDTPECRWYEPAVSRELTTLTYLIIDAHGIIDSVGKF